MSNFNQTGGLAVFGAVWFGDKFATPNWLPMFWSRIGKKTNWVTKEENLVKVR